jgi:predicted transcriptional regulator
MQSVRQARQPEVPGEKEVALRSSPAKNRGRIDVIADILSCCQPASSKSRIMLSANINSIVATRVIGNLVKTGLLDSVRRDDMVTYLATPKGIQFITKYLELQGLVSSDLVPETKTRIASRLFGLSG